VVVLFKHCRTEEKRKRNMSREVSVLEGKREKKFISKAKKSFLHVTILVISS